MSVTIIGDAFIDVLVPVQGTKPGETHHRKIITLCGGTANVAVQIAKLGETSKFVGRVGHDAFGVYFRHKLRMNGVEDLTFMDYENPTGLCISLSYDDGERMMVANRGANDYLESGAVRNCINKIIDSKIVYFSGYSLLSKRNAESILYAIKECHEQNCKVYFNPGAPNLMEKKFKEIVRDFVDVLILNKDEARNMSEKDEIEEISKTLNNIADTVVITMNDGGCVLAREDEYIQIETEKLNVLDTTGAGDAFAAGFIIGELKGKKYDYCAKIGNDTAANFLKEKMGVLE